LGVDKTRALGREEHRFHTGRKKNNLAQSPKEQGKGGWITNIGQDVARWEKKGESLRMAFKRPRQRRGVFMRRITFEKKTLEGGAAGTVGAEGGRSGGKKAGSLGVHGGRGGITANS